MRRNFSFFMDDDSDELVNRYELYLSGGAPGYFDVDEMEKIADYYLAYGRTKDSMQAIDLGKKLHPTSDALDMKRAKIYLTTGDPKKALRILSNLIEDSDFEVTFMKIEALATLERFQEAFELAKKLIAEENNENIDIICNELAMVFIKDGMFELALELLKIGEEHNPRNIDLLFDIAFCQEQKTMLSDAIQTYKRIIDIDPYAGEAWFNLGQVYFLLNQYNDAIDAYDYALAINEKDTISLIQKGHSHFQLGQWKQAVEMYLEFEQTSSNKWQIWLFIAECYEKMEDFPEALHYYKLSYNEIEDNYDAIVGIAVCLLELELFHESLEYIQKALEIESELADVWIYLAEAKMRLGEYKEALKAYHQAVSIDPNQPDALLEMGNIYMDFADFKTALKYYELAYSFDQTLEFIELFIAVTSYYTKDYDKSTTFLELAIHRNLDAKKLFLELCPGAEEKFLKIAHGLPKE
ncbi:MAG: tetratricopeptide repeat protein [Bacteroidales bacterium]|nr:tetratricopeptide repeat protein [Bacteroidales bacterium]